MSLPNFLGIGAQRSGSTWLHELLTTHPDVYVPSKRKELNFFDTNYDKGLAWYESFFPPQEEVGRYQAVGEITPDYIYYPVAVERIAQVLPGVRLIVILRNPVNRAFSQYSKMVRDDNCQLSFEEALEQEPELIKRGFYSEALREYLRRFGKEHVLVLIFEESTEDLVKTKHDLASFLNVEAAKFPAEAGSEKVYESYIPRSRGAYAQLKSFARTLRRFDLDPVVNVAKTLGFKKVFHSEAKVQPMNEETRLHLQSLYDNDIQALETLLSRSLTRWRVKS
jgi:Sulfotransferase domain